MLKENQSSLVDCLIAQSTDLVCICDEGGTILRSNKQFAQSAAKSTEQTIGISVKLLFLDENKNLGELLYDRILNLVGEDHFHNDVKTEEKGLMSVSWHLSKCQNLCVIRGTISKCYLTNPALDKDLRLKAIVNHTSDCFFILDEELNVVYKNPAAIKKFSHPQFNSQNNIFFGCFPEETNRKFASHFTRLLNTNSHIKFVEFSALLNCWFTIDVLSCGSELNILINDISDRIIDHKLNELELKTFQLNIAKDRPVNEILGFLLSAFEELYPQLHTSILKIEDGKIWTGASPSLPKSFLEAIDGFEIGSNAGSCGAAAFLKKSVITFDIETDKKWAKYHHYIAGNGYKSCWSFPILSNKSLEVMATFALYTKENLTPTESELKSIARICNIIKIIFEDLKQDDLLLLMNNRYEMVTKATNDAIYDWDLKTNSVYWSENLTNIFGFTPKEASQPKNWWLSHIHKSDRARTIALLKRCLREKQSGWVAEYRLECKNGDFKHVYNRGYIIYDANGIAITIIGAIQDISGLKEREVEIINQNKKLKEIAQISSHDLRRPVTSILGLISLFNKQNMVDENNILVVDYLQKAAEELDQVIHSIVGKTLAADDTIYSNPHTIKTSVFPKLE